MSQTKSQLLFVLGPGGVGKTTTAASLALSLAQEGYRTCVLTVDPAKRLAQALGLETLSNDAQLVKKYPPGSNTKRGEASALWLDSSEAFEKLIKRFTSHGAAQDFILENRLFNILKSQLGGVEEYLGTERILSLAKSGIYDYCIIDTAPSRHALDFIDSPQHLLRFFDESVLKYFLKKDGASEEKSGLFKRLLKGTRDQALEIFQSFLGQGFIQELAVLLEAIQPVREVLKKHAEEIMTLVKSDSCHFIGVSTLEYYPLFELRGLHMELRARGLAEMSLLTLNKCLTADAPSLEALQKAIGDNAGQKLYNRHLSQRSLVKKLESEKWANELLRAELPRYSLRQLSTVELEDMGGRILRVWKTR